MEAGPQQCKHFLESSLPPCQPASRRNQISPAQATSAPPSPPKSDKSSQPPLKPLLSLPSSVRVSHSLTCWWTTAMCVWWQQIGDWAPPSCAQEKPAAGEASHRGDPTTVLLPGAHRFTHKPLKRLPFQVRTFH